MQVSQRVLIRVRHVGLVFFLAASGCEQTEQPLPPIDAPMMMPMAGAGPESTPFIMPANVDPRLAPAAEVSLNPAEAVIGVVIDGSARCYLQRAMSDLEANVLNENRTARPYCVTWCDRTDTVRVFAGRGGEALELRTGGFSDGRMLLLHSGQMFPQDSAELPYEDLNFVRTTYGEWVQEHPESLVFSGGLSVGNAAASQSPVDPADASNETSTVQPDPVK